MDKHVFLPGINPIFCCLKIPPESLQFLDPKKMKKLQQKIQSTK
jgi:hypothetical protein